MFRQISQTGAVLAIALVPFAAHGQAVAEYGIAAAGLSTGAVAAKGLKAGAAGALTKLEKASDPKGVVSSGAPAAGNARTRSPKTTATPTKAAAELAPVEPPAANYEDASGIKAGIEYSEVIRRFGPPALEITAGPSSKILSYHGKNGPVQVELSEGKVITAKQP